MPLRCLLPYRCYHAFCHCTDDVTTLTCLSGVCFLTGVTVNHVATKGLAGTVKQEGLAALWKGFGPTWLRLGPWQFCFWVTYEELRLQTTGEGF
jgi:solute carrier family 25 uncoupling protein 27